MKSLLSHSIQRLQHFLSLIFKVPKTIKIIYIVALFTSFLIKFTNCSLSYLPLIGVNMYFNPRRSLILAVILISVASGAHSVIFLLAITYDGISNSLSNIKLRKLQIINGAIQNNRASAIIIIQDKQIIFNNHKASEIICNGQELLEYSTILEFLQKSNLNTFYNQLQASNDKEASYKFQEQMISKSLKYYHVSMHIVQANVHIITFTECSHYSQYLKEKEESTSKDIMIASCAHEIRNSLQTFTIFLDLAMNSCMNSQTAEVFQHLVFSKESLLSVIKDLLDFSLIKKGILEIYISSVDISEVINGISVVYSNSCKIKKIAFITEIDPALPVVVRTDKTRFSQIIINLVTNAIKFTLHGSIKVSLKSQTPQKMLLIVKDTGIGIKQVDKSKLFNAFSKLKDENSLNPNGVGLGLMITQKLSLRLGDGISAYSEEGQGAIFTVVLNTGLSTSEYESSIKLGEYLEMMYTCKEIYK